MNKKSHKEIVLAVVFLVAAIGVINSLGIVFLDKNLFTAQVLYSDKILNYGVAQNDFGSNVGITFKSKLSVMIKACGGGGGGGGGGRGWENGSNVGYGGGGGGGGGRGECQTRTIRVRQGDNLRWLVGVGGNGGSAGVIDLSIPSEVYFANSVATDGENGGYTYVSLNGIDIMQVPGGLGGRAGLNAYDGIGLGGNGGSLVGSESNWNKGGDGQAPHYVEGTNVYVSMGNGGRGGRGENNESSGDNSTSGSPGVSSGPNPFGNHGLDGAKTFGGGGGGGGAGRWYDYDVNGNDYNNAIKNRGGSGGRGGDGYVEISW